MSNNPVQPTPIPIPPMPAEIHQTEQRAQEWLKQHEDVPQLLSRKHLSLSKIMVLVFLVVTLPLTVFVVSQQQKLAEVRSKAAEATPAAVTSTTTPTVPGRRYITSKARDYDRLMKTYFQEYVADPAQINAKIWNVSVADKQIQGTIHLKYDEAVNQTFVLARLTGLVLPKDKELVRVWIVRKGEYIPLGGTDFEVEGGWRVGYSVFAKDGDLRDSDEMVVGYTTWEGKKPEAGKIILSLDFKEQ